MQVMKLPGNGTVEFSGSEHSHIASTQIKVMQDGTDTPK